MISTIRNNFKPYEQIWPRIALRAAGYEKQLLYYRNKNKGDDTKFQSNAILEIMIIIVIIT